VICWDTYKGANPALFESRKDSASLDVFIEEPVYD
jgi:hypothetical protein